MINGAGEYAHLKAKVYAEALTYMGYDAVGVGEMDARYMKEYGQDRPFGKDVPVITANVVNPENSKPVAREAYVVKKTKNGLKVGIVSALSEVLVDAYFQEKIGIRPLPVKEVLPKILPKVREESDLVVLLYHGDPKTAKELAAQFPEIDVMIQGHSSGAPESVPTQEGKTIIADTRSSGKYVGKVVLEIAADRTISGFSGEYLPMDTTYQDDEQMTRAIAQNDKDLEDYYARLRMQYAKYTNDPSQPRSPQPFVTASKCRECHAAEYDSWSKTGHAKAYDALKKDHKVHDPECLSCHTTGYKMKGGFTSDELTPELAQVQCETCHGPGVIHSRRPAKGYGLTMKSTCTQCHDRANSPKFDHDVYRIKILHKKDGAGTAVIPVAK